MSEIELIKKEIDKINNKYLENVLEIISDYKKENETKNDYKDRQLYELLQNADDCFTAECNDIDVKIKLIGNTLIIQNTGKPFDARGIASLMHSNASSKYSDTIGCKGLGFRSVLNWANDVTICTKEFCVNFSEVKAKEKYDYYKKSSDKSYIEELDKIDRIAVLCSASLMDKSKISEYLDDKYSTAIVLCCEEKYVSSIQTQLKELQFEELLFLKHVRNIVIESDAITRNIEAIKENDTFLIQEENQCTEWKIWGKNGTIKQPNGEDKKYELVIAYNTNPVIRENIRKNGVLYSFFKTEIPMPFPFLIHGTFDLTSERNSLIKDSDNNRKLIEYLVDFIIEKGTIIADSNQSCDYEALKFLIPATDLYFLDREYDFSNLLKEKVKNYKVFPTISGKYISINDNPKYSDKDFCDILNPNTFSNLLKHCDDNRIRNFMIIDNRINFYSDEEITNLINLDADEYVQNQSNTKLIELYCEQYRNSQVAPNILSDNDGNRITDNSIKVFNNPENIFSLPSWSKLRFINKTLENSLRSYWKCNARQMADKLEYFNCDEYSFDRVLRELISQCKEEKDKITSLLNWLFTTWKNNDQKFASSLTNIDVKAISREGNIIGCSKCYFGSEYNNIIGERIISNTTNPTFISKPNELGLENESPELVKAFLKQLGVKEYPIIELIELSNEQISDYINYNAKFFSTLHTDRDESMTHSTFFSKYGRIIKVDAIKDIESILEKSNFNDILYWILNDKDLYSHIISDIEISDDAYMRGWPPNKKEARFVRKSQMKSWLNKIFMEYEWLPTLSNKKVNSYNCTLAQHKLSPIVEVLNVNYESLNSLFNRNCKKDIEALLEKLNVADDIEYLSKEKIYEIMLNLPELDKDYTLGKKIYTQLNLYFKDDRLNKLITDNKKYEEFKKEGKVLAEVNKKYQYLPLKEVYYVGKKVYSDDILDSFPKFALNRRVGDSKVEKMFGVQSILKIGNVEVKDIVEHALNSTYQKEYQKILPYIYAKRIDYDYKNRELNVLKKSKLCLVSQASTVYYIGGEEKKGILKDYEVIYSINDKIAYIKIPEFLQSIDQLKEQTPFINAVSEVITTIIDVDGDKDAFIIILSKHTTKEVEEYFKGNGDETLSIVNLSKERFSTIIDSKEEFWDAISQATNLDINDLMELEVYSAQINYDNLNSDDNYDAFISIFETLNIEVSDYNKYAYEPIDLTTHYQNEFVSLKNKYRNKYLKYLLKGAIKNNGFYEDFDGKRHSYDFFNLSMLNSINFNIKDNLEAFIGVSLDELDLLDDDYEELLQDLKNIEKSSETKRESENNQEEQMPVAPKKTIDYTALNDEIASEDNSITVKGNIVANPINRDTHSDHEGKKEKPHSESSQETKDYNGFVAESKVFNVLEKKIGKNGSVEWLSGNAEKANKVEHGDDTLGYDMRYSDSNGIHYVEVKGSSANNIEFTLTKNEFDFAEKHKDSYELWFVPIVNERPQNPIELGNILLFENGENFFNNSRFSVEQSEFKIRAKLKESED